MWRRSAHPLMRTNDFMGRRSTSPLMRTNDFMGRRSTHPLRWATQWETVYGTSVASKFLCANGITLFKVREGTIKLLGKSDMYYFNPEHPPLTEPAQRALNWALDEKMKSECIGRLNRIESNAAAIQQMPRALQAAFDNRFDGETSSPALCWNLENLRTKCLESLQCIRRFGAVADLFSGA
ncbi:uncharacterized protein LOC131246284 [Magnolia sinica]|uniref:uncharacterized protein LOC131246284 n=1 Tax=Magnolia sinica TaxID=86752 RepID=UPI0026582CF2|nr:uncharacterized protein LOC131246284 [Magnolia sinica]